jgi:hypothetical protein
VGAAAGGVVELATAFVTTPDLVEEVLSLVGGLEDD